MNILKFLAFASLAVGIKLVTPWSPIDIFLAFSFWVGHQIKKDASPPHKIFYLISLIGTVVISDFLFALAYDRTFIYPGIAWNEFCIVSACLIPLIFSTRVTMSVMGVVGISSSVILFFVLSNLGVFFFSSLYSHTWEGIIACFVAALPFVKVQWISNIATTVAVNFVENKVFSQYSFKHKF